MLLKDVSLSKIFFVKIPCTDADFFSFFTLRDVTNSHYDEKGSHEKNHRRQHRKG